MNLRATILCLFVFSTIGIFVPLAAAGDAPTPQRISVTPTRFTLNGGDSWRQLIVTGENATKATFDVTGSVAYEAQPANIVAIDKSGLATPLAEGKATITITAQGAAPVKVEVVVAHLTNEPTINFANQIVPILTKFACNSGGCHGKASGQNNFKLSLLGFEPEEDYEYLVKEARASRRVMATAPDHSMLLTKASGTMSHGGGKKFAVDSPYYRLIRRWIEQGTPYGQASDPVVTRIEVLPRERIMARRSTQQLAVIAHMSDGSTLDVTRMTQFETNEKEIAEPNENGLVRTGNTPGVAAVMARFQAHVDTFRSVVPLGEAVAKFPKANNIVDELVFKQLKTLGLPPSELADDGTFLRRVTIDIAGRLPTQKETEDFLANKDPERHAKLVDTLLASKDYADVFASKWSSILRNRRKTINDAPQPTFAFHAWIRQSLETNMPYDKFVREVLTATGEEIKTPAVQWYREVKDAPSQLEDMAQLFLGQRIGCAKCHHHPFEKWNTDDYWGLAAFFSRVAIKEAKKGKKKGDPGDAFMVTMKSAKAEATNPKTRQSIKPRGLGGKDVILGADEDPRQKLVDWMVEKDNPFFATTLANRYWKHFFSRGLVEPEDDLRVTNPPTNPELLDALTKHFVASKFDMKSLVRLICTSNTYRLSSIPNTHNTDDKQNFSRFLPRRLHAEVLHDAIDQVTLNKPAFKGVPAGTRAVQLPDNMFESYFLSVFGRPDFASACECERSSDTNLAQCLLLYNSADLMKKVAGQRVKNIAGDKRSHADRLKELYVITFSRQPTADELRNMTAYIEARPNATATAYEDIVWALLNTKEFLFNH